MQRNSSKFIIGLKPFFNLNKYFESLIKYFIYNMKKGFLSDYVVERDPQKLINDINGMIRNDGQLHLSNSNYNKVKDPSETNRYSSLPLNYP